MATEEVSKPRSLPPYSEMIFAAIDNLNDKNGVNKSAISKYIESTYGEVPDYHQALLTENLNQLTQSGELILTKNLYMRTNPTTPAKRGRGRPPKVKSSSAAPPPSVDVYVGPPRSRGRPPKAKDPSSVVAAATPPTPKASSGRGRGRPPKKQPMKTMDTEEEEDDDAEDEEEAVTTTVVAPVKTTAAVTGTPRPRGRPPKAKAQLTVV